jgi:hypothetical protein
MGTAEMTMPDTNSYTTRKAYIEAWGRYFEQRMDAGWEGYLITLMFKHIPGSEAARLRVMEQELYRVYATHLSRLFRRPNAPRNRGKLPIWIASPDYPVETEEQYVVGYGFKTVVKRASIGVDGMIVLPRTSNEVR